MVEGFLVKPLLFIDSGAYSASTKGATIDMHAYVQFLRRWDKYIDVAASLDVLSSPEQSWANQLAMEAMGVKPLPCFHLGEDPKWLVRYVERYDYIALGGLVGTSPSQQAMWLDDIWKNYLTNDGEAIVRVHAFGVTSPHVMQRYPWFSVDSTSWLLQAAMGRIQIAVKDPHSGFWEFVSLAVSSKSDDAGHIDTLPEGVRAGVLKRLGEFDIAELQTDYKKRFSFNADEYAKLAREIKWKPYVPQYALDLFSDGAMNTIRKIGMKPWEHLTLYLAGNPGSQGTTREVMQKGYHRLMSYHYIKEAEKNFAEAREVLDAYHQTT